MISNKCFQIPFINEICSDNIPNRKSKCECFKRSASDYSYGDGDGDDSGGGDDDINNDSRGDDDDSGGGDGDETIITIMAMIMTHRTKRCNFQHLQYPIHPLKY